MTPFEFVFALISIITSLALTHVIAGAVGIIRHRERGSFSWVHALWMWIAFAVVVANWGTLWNARLDPEWPALRVLAWLATMTSLYVFCVLVVPDIDRGKPLDLGEFHAAEGRRYVIAHNIFALLGAIAVVALRGIGQDAWPLLVPPVLALLLGLWALACRGRAQLWPTLGVAALATIFMLANLSIDAR